MKKRAKSYWKIGGEDRISKLRDDLLVRILMFVPTKSVVATMILSKRWKYEWTMVPQLVYKEIKYGTRKRFLGGLLGCLFGITYRQQQPRSLWRFLEKSLQIHKATVLQMRLSVGFMWSAEPTTLPKSLYTCDTLYHLSLSNKILVDVPSTACFPSLQQLSLYSVVYKDEDSHFRFLSSCPILKNLAVERHNQDNVTTFNIKVPTLKCLFYDYVNEGVYNGSLVIDSPAIKRILIRDFSGDSCSIVKAIIHVFFNPDNKLIRSLSSIMYLELLLVIPTAACCNAINFSQLIYCKIILQNELDWLEPLMLLLQNSPNLRVLFIHQDLPLSWNQPSSVPGCLSSNLEIFEWKEYGGRSEEKQVVKYIANS